MDEFKPFDVELPSVSVRNITVTKENRYKIISELCELVDDCQALIRRINNPSDYRSPDGQEGTNA
jgi:hypothetical protein